MIQGIGTDLVSLKHLNLDHRHFIERVLTLKELEMFDALKTEEAKRAFLGGRFAAKEAFLKAHHVGIGAISFQEMEVLNDESGVPYFSHSHAHLSISHMDDYAVAFVIWEGERE